MSDLQSSHDAPPPTLKILPMAHIQPHELHDAQRAKPLLKILAAADVLTNPPIVAPMPDDRYVVLDGANRYHCFCELGYEQLLVQVAAYDSNVVEVGVWQHVISAWESEALVEALQAIPDVQLKQGWNPQAVAQVLTRDGTVLAIDAPDETIEERNHTLRQIVQTYHQQATLNRTTSKDPTTIWDLFPEAIALVLFPSYQPADIIAAAQHEAYLPPGISRHIIHGRALKLNYPLATLKDTSVDIQTKNDNLQAWVRERLSQRAVRYYAESTYIFDE